jgi:6-phosphofructokinase 1
MMYEQLITSERLILKEYENKRKKFPTDVKTLLPAKYKNPVSESELGAYRTRDRRKCITADLEMIQRLAKKGSEIPGFLEAGPRKMLAFAEPRRPTDGLNVGVVTSGGLAPGLNSVVHSIVERHINTYGKLRGNGGVWGILDSFKGLAQSQLEYIDLTPEKTEDWLQRGGSELGAIRYMKYPLEELAKKIAKNLEYHGVRILYVVGGDGSLTAAHAIASVAKNTIVVGIPKTMDNDILWVWQSFGFNSAVERAASFINTMHYEVEGTRRVAVLEFFGARSGFVAANATLASGHVDLVMVPEVFEGMTKTEAIRALDECRNYLAETIRRKPRNPHAVIVIAEGVGKALSELGVVETKKAEQFAESFGSSLQLRNVRGEMVAAFTIQPRHYIRAIPANPHDQIYCERLGALAVDNALAGFTDFMISQWLTEYVLVPLELVAGGQKHLPTGGIFWKQVVASTGQPTISRQQAGSRRRRRKRSKGK